MNAVLPALTFEDDAFSRPLKIALLGYRSHPFVGGQGIYLKYLSRALHQRGHEVHVYSGPPYPQVDPTIPMIKVPSLNLYEEADPLRALRWRHLKSFTDSAEWWGKISGGFSEPWAFGRRMQKQKKLLANYDVIHDNQSLCHALLNLQDSGLPVCSTLHHPIHRDREAALQNASNWGERLFIRRWYHFLGMQEKVVAKLNALITVSEQSNSDIEHYFKRPRSRTTVIPNGVNTRQFCPDPSVRRRPFYLITTTSSDQAVKGFSTLLQALKNVRKEFPSTRLLVIGQLNPEGNNQKLIQQLQLQNAVEFKHGLSEAELIHEYRRAHAAVCPSLYEGFGLPAAEVMSCGTPLISSNGGALPEVVGDAGLIFPAGDSDALSKQIIEVFSDTRLCNALSHMGRERVEQHFCWDQVALQVELFYRREFSLS